MEKNNTINTKSSTTICSKIREVLSSYPAFRAIHHRLNNKQKHHQHNNHRSSASNSITITKHANNKVIMNKERGEQGAVIPINYDYSSGKKPTSSSTNNNNKGTMKIIQQQQKKQETIDLNGAFKEFIDRVRNGMNEAENNSNYNNAAGGGGSALLSHHHEGNNNKMENQKDHHFSEFIQSSRKKLRTTSNIASFKRG
ncbi:hypothetical protein PIB30_000979 [Stylosanthes scabra]|uniref:Uncharacterized protein n=1 Tax=Stylosanthes scabra TaxID=79078 RepID=A0ABU6S273_9FABA|nr:hypothetical protein [Stylosanthes scabra]